MGRWGRWGGGADGEWLFRWGWWGEVFLEMKNNFLL
ncbi:carbamoyl-phosphate synthase large subunit, partial [Lyngbya sp. PCC 8106]